MAIIGFPLLLIPLAVCNIVIFMMPGVAFEAPLATVRLWSGTAWSLSIGDLMVSLGALMLLLEVIKAGRPGAKYVTDHLLSLLVFVAAAAEFVMLPRFGISTVFLLALLALVDFLAGIALRGCRPRRAAAATPAAAKPAPEPVADTESEPAAFDAPAPVTPALTAAAPAATATPALEAPAMEAPVPAAAPAAESVTPAPTPAIESEPSPPAISSPELQPAGEAGRAPASKPST